MIDKKPTPSSESSLVNFVKEEINQFGYEILSQDIRDELLNVIQFDYSDESLPGNMEEMGHLCSKIDEILHPVFYKLEQINKRRSYKSKLKQIQKSRLKIQKAIIQKQRKEKKWQGLKWPSKEQAIKNVQKVVRSYLNLPDTLPFRGSRLWEKCRQKIIGIKGKRKTLESWGLHDASYHKWFHDVIDILIAAFDEDYDIKEELEKGKRKKIKCRSPEQAIANVKTEVGKILQLPEKVSKKGTPEWKKNRQKIIDLKDKRKILKKLGLNKVFQWFDSAVEVFVAAFGKDYNIKEEDIKGRWRSRKQTIINVKTEVGKKLELPEKAPTKGTPEWRKNRKKILKLRSRKLIKWKLARAFVDNDYFDSYIDVLIAAFDEDYDIKEELEKRKKGKKIA